MIKFRWYHIADCTPIGSLLLELSRAYPFYFSTVTCDSQLLRNNSLRL